MKMVLMVVVVVVVAKRLGFHHKHHVTKQETADKIIAYIHSYTHTQIHSFLYVINPCHLYKPLPPQYAVGEHCYTYCVIRFKFRSLVRLFTLKYVIFSPLISGLNKQLISNVI